MDHHRLALTVITAISVDYPEIAEVKGTVRGRLVIGGW